MPNVKELETQQKAFENWRSLVARFGSPLYVYDLDTVEHQVRELKQALPTNAKVFYSLKANPLPAIVKTVQTAGCCLEVCSNHELSVAYNSGISIESTLQRHPAVVNAAVKVIGEQPQNAYLAAYLIAKNETEVDWQEVKQYAEEFLPDYMIPTRFIFLEQFPLGATGKVDRKALPIPSDYQHSQNSEPPDTDTERNLARLWSEILGIETLMREDNFFELGGNSLSAIRLMALIADTFDLNIPVTTLLQHSTLKALSQFIDEHYHRGVDSAETCLVSITGHQSKPPIFWFHPSGGGILCYKDLAQPLSERFGCLALEASGTSTQKSQLSLSEMTKLYLKEIHSANPSGPYHLGGWSMGGVIAYEAAQQLTKQGIKVDSLVLIDSPAPLRQEATEFKQLISWFVSDLAEVDQDLALNCLQEENNSTNLLLQALTEAQQKHWLPAGNIQDLISLFEIFRSNIEALHSYQALPLKNVSFTDELDIVTPEMLEGGVDVTLTYSKSANTVVLEADFTGLPYRIDIAREDDPSTPYNQYPVSIEDTRWQLWMLARINTVESNFWYDGQTGDLIGNEFDILVQSMT